MRQVLLVISAGLSASLMGFLISSALLKSMGNRVLVFYIPAVEELLKTLGAVIFGAPVVPAHFVFGMVEGLYDLYSSPPDRSFTAFVLSIVSHTLLGTAAWLAIRVSGSVFAAVLASTVLHSLWNRIMTEYTG
ncbi:MAG: hypothetical protein GXY97_11000 [Clostridiales bacterium]|nr:hypothetical protein [Clostridiales bacterium]